ncbi:MAG: succinate dehydrogenase cytochrome b subunit [Nannocystaceae bacterium]
MTNSNGAPRSPGTDSLARSTIGAKVVMAVTGAVWLGWLIAHMLGNLGVFAGRDTFNAYAALLQTSGLVLWGMRLTMLAALVAHVGAAMRLSALNLAARPHQYARKQHLRASFAGRFMLVSGLLVLAFVVYHLLHFTLGVTHPDHFNVVDAQGRHDAYGMLVRGFQTPLVAAIYLVALAALSLHLSHAITSMLNTFGITTDGHPFFSRVGPAIATILILGNVAIVLGVSRDLQPDPGVISR